VRARRSGTTWQTFAISISFAIALIALAATVIRAYHATPGASGIRLRR